jgi:hypothetical protein
MSHWSPEMELVKAPSPVVHSPSAEAWLPATLPESVNSPVVSIDVQVSTTCLHLLHGLTPPDAGQCWSPSPPAFLAMVHSSAATDNVSCPFLSLFFTNLFHSLLPLMPPALRYPLASHHAPNLSYATGLS